MKYRLKGKVQFQFFRSFWIVLKKFSFWQEDWALVFLIFPKILRSKVWSRLVTHKATCILIRQLVKLKIALTWFKDNQMMANPGKFQFMILSKNTINKSIVINNKTIESSKSVKLLGLTIDNKLNFGIHINNICKVASAKIKCLGRIRSRLNLSHAKILDSSFIFSQFNYCCLVWMFCSKTLQNKINQIQKRALRIVCNEFKSW